MLTIDWDSLRTSSMEDSELAAELIELFLSDTPIQLEGLSGCIETSNAKGVRQIAHKLKGSCLTIGAVSMADVCGQLETAAENRFVADLPRLGSLLSQEFETAGTEFRSKAWDGNLFADVNTRDD